MLRDWAVGVQAAHEEHMLDATYGLDESEEEGELSAAEEMRIAMQNNEVMSAMGMGF